VTLWRLWRQDDHGTQVPVRDFATREEAERARDEYEAKGHHQHYWVEAVPAGQ
jgi:hypothetical protein